MNKVKRQRPIKILFIHHGKGIGGASLSLLFLVKKLDRSKFHPIVLFMADSAAVEMFVREGVEVVGPINKSDFSHTKIWWLRWYHPHHLAKAALHSAQLIFGLADFWLDKIKPDIVHLNTSSLFAWAVRAKKKGIPVVWHVREPLSPGYFGVRRCLTAWAVKRFSDVIVPICQDNASPWVRLEKTKVVYNAVPEERFKDACRPKLHRSVGGSSILFLGGLSQEKGTLFLLEAFDKVLEQIPSAQLIIAGTWEPKFGSFGGRLPITSWHRFCRKVEAKLSTAKNVHVIGVQHDIAELISRSNLLVFPATVGHFARPVIEAGFMGKPTVATGLPPLDELIVDGQTGLLSKPGDAKDLADKIYRVLSCPAFAKELGKNAKKFCQTNFGLQRQIDKIDQIYDQILNQ